MEPVSRHVAMLTSTDMFPQISPFSVDPQLRDFTNFLRTVPSDTYQTTAIVDLLRYFNWTYVSVVVSDDYYGRLAMAELRIKMKEKGICIAVAEVFDPQVIKLSGNEELDNIVDDLHKMKNVSNVVILWCNADDALRIIQRANDKSPQNPNIWIGAEVWTQHQIQILSTITNLQLIKLETEGDPIPAFINHKNKLKYKDPSPLNNPWLIEFWKTHKYCEKIPDRCKNISQTMLFTQNHENVMYAVYAIAHGLHAYLGCNATTCVNITKPFVYQDIIEHIKQVNFTIPSSSSVFKFNKDGEKTFISYVYKVRQFQQCKPRSRSDKEERNR